jgi:DNA repair exonuclease SbcCD ATPase subunit
MTKQREVAQELKGHFAQGNLKPSQLKKSKSTGDLPAANLPAEQPRRKSIDLLSNPQSLKTQLQKAQDEISILELKLETCQRELDEKALVEKENSELKKQLTSVQSELDNSLQARHQNLKVFGQEHSKRVQAEKEVSDTVEESSEELVNFDKVISDLRLENFKLKQTNSQLSKDLSLSSRLAELRKVPYFEDEFNGLNYFKYAVYALLTV